MNTVAHPCRFGDVHLAIFAEYLEPGWRLLDPFAGIGRIHALTDLVDVTTVGIEIEPEWARCHPRTLQGDARALPFPDASFDAICTSPTFGNRMADCHDARDGSHRVTYKHTLGRDLTPGNSGAMQWGPKYRALHERAWDEAVRVLRPGGMFLLNIKDHVRAGAVVPVKVWHTTDLTERGLALRVEIPIPTSGMGYGANANVRVPYEFVLAFRRPR